MGNAIFADAIEALKFGGSAKDLVDKFNISLDQAKKISQIYKMISVIEDFEPKLQEKFYKLGYKVLVLSPLFRKNDIEGIKEILESIDPNIRRDDLKLLPEALEIKRERLKNTKIEAEYKMQYLERIQVEIEEIINDSLINKKKLDETIGFLDDVKDKKAKEFLMDHLGIANGKIVLYKRLDISWQQSLKRNKVIEYNKSTYTWEISNLDELKRQTEKRILKKNNMFYDPSKASDMFADRYPEDPVYKKAEGLGTSFMDAVNDNEKKIKELKKKKRDINKELRELKGTKVQTYMDSAELANHLSENEILTHRRLQNSAMKYLYNNDYVSITEVTQETHRFDVVGYNQKGEVTIVEAKASIGDFRSDDKFNKYLTFCNKMFFIFTDEIYNRYEYEIVKKLSECNIGVLVEVNNKVECISKSNSRQIDRVIREELIFKINRLLNRKYIYGR